MPAQIVSFLRFPQPLRDWSQQELAEFYRVESALIRAGMAIETERGLSDDGDPWFAFCRAEDGEVFIHFARIDGEYILAGPGYEGISRGRDFAALVRDLISRHPLVQPAAGRSSNNNVFLHPAALLIAVVATAFFKTNEAKADDGHAGHDRHRPPTSAIVLPASASQAVTIAVDADQTLAVVASAMAALDDRGSLLNPVNALGAEADYRLAHDTSVWLPTGPDPMALQSATWDDATVSSSSVPLGGPPSAAGQVGAWLSLATLLHDLTGATSFAPAQIGPAEGASLAVRTVQPAASSTAVGAQDLSLAGDVAHNHSILAVELVPGPLPDVTAVRVLHDSGVDLTGGDVVQVSKLPDLLADFIARGDHVSVDDLSVAVQPPAPTDAIVAPDTTVVTPDNSVASADNSTVSPDGTTPNPATSLDATSANPTQPPLHDGPDHSATPPATSDASVPATTPAAPVTAPAATTAPATSSAPAPESPAPAVTPITAAHDAAIAGAVSYFTAHTADMDVVVSGNQVVLYDDQIMTNATALLSSESVTYTFADGSSISLVGAPSAILDHILH